ncbi:MAG: maleylacetoacetate isomerase [Porphyrobacter sp.]|nr:maleylacetoacetate isomerase [Porphyrobacter sp.]
MSAPLTLHGYWRSGTSYRTRIALEIKGVAYEQAPVDLRAGDQKSDAFRALNPQGLVPALETPDGVLTQSPAILEWLEERYPEPPLLPREPGGRAIVRAMAMAVACDIHPLNNLRVLKYLKHPLGHEQPAIDSWIGHWIGQGFAALEATIARHGGRFAYGDSLTLADCHLVPQFYAAERYSVDCSAYPRLVESVRNAMAEEPVRRAHPDLQPDAAQA